MAEKTNAELFSQGEDERRHGREARVSGGEDDDGADSDPFVELDSDLDVCMCDL